MSTSSRSPFGAAGSLRPGSGRLGSLRLRFAKRHPIDLGGRVEDTVLISGVGRSGTTWLSDFLNFDDAYRDMFEPFHAWKVPAARALEGHWYQTADFQPPAPVAEYVERVLRGRIRDPWIDRFNRRIVSRRRIVKAIRADLFLAWAARRFPKLRIVHLIRYPEAVVRSRARLPSHWEWRPSLVEVLAQDRLRDSLSEGQRNLCDSASTTFEEHVATWCLSTRAVLTGVPTARRATVFYEDLVRDPEPTLRRIFEAIGRAWDPRCLEVRSVSSATARGRVARNEGARAEDTEDTEIWVERMTPEERRWLEKALDLFGLSDLYDSNGRPRGPF
jgi:hypothetical protein